LIALREETEKALGARFNQKKFHDFILAQGLLPPDMMRKAVTEVFVPEQQKQAAAQGQDSAAGEVRTRM